LQAIASETGVAIVIIHHLRKSQAEVDPFEKVSGTLGLSGAADTVLILDRDGQGATLYGRGRDIDEIETAIQFDKRKCRWMVLGEAEEVRRSDERKGILDALKGAKGPLTPRDVADLTGGSHDAVRQLLLKMVANGEIARAGRGRYVCDSCDSQPTEESQPNLFADSIDPQSQRSQTLENSENANNSNSLEDFNCDSVCDSFSQESQFLGEIGGDCDLVTDVMGGHRGWQSQAQAPQIPLRVIGPAQPGTVCIKCHRSDGRVMKIIRADRSGSKTETLHEMPCAKDWFEAVSS
jgi:hypothetical protein